MGPPPDSPPGYAVQRDQGGAGSGPQTGRAQVWLAHSFPPAPGHHEAGSPAAPRMAGAQASTASLWQGRLARGPSWACPREPGEG